MPSAAKTWIQGVGLGGSRAWGLGFRVKDIEFRVKGLEFRVESLQFAAKVSGQ